MRVHIKSLSSKPADKDVPKPNQQPLAHLQLSADFNSTDLLSPDGHDLLASVPELNPGTVMPYCIFTVLGENPAPSDDEISDNDDDDEDIDWDQLMKSVNPAKRLRLEVPPEPVDLQEQEDIDDEEVKNEEKEAVIPSVTRTANGRLRLCMSTVLQEIKPEPASDNEQITTKRVAEDSLSGTQPARKRVKIEGRNSRIVNTNGIRNFLFVRRGKRTS